MAARLKLARRGHNVRDGTGRVRVQITLVDERHQHQKGNIVRVFSVRRTKVSTVARQIEGLFGEGT